MGFFGEEYRKICKIFLTVNQPVTKKLEIFFIEKFDNSKNFSIFAMSNETRSITIKKLKNGNTKN